MASQDGQRRADLIERKGGTYYRIPELLIDVYRNKKMASQSGQRADYIERQGNVIVGSKDFKKLSVIGEGGFAKVTVVRKHGGHDHGALYADKQLSKERVMRKEKTLQHTLAELEVLQAVAGRPFLAQLHYAFQTSGNLHLIMDFINGGPLSHHLERHDYFEESEVRVYVAELTVALQTLHEMGIVYRDLKPDNVLLDSQGHVVLADFGLAKKFPAAHPTKRTSSFCGTAMYMSPEMIITEDHGFETDWFSLGVLTFELLTGKNPFLFPNDSVKTTLRRVLQGKIDYPSSFSRACKDFIKKLLSKDPACRLGAGGAEEVKAHPFFKSMNWEKLVRKEILPPFIPGISHELDLSNFNNANVSAAVRQSLPNFPAIGMDIFKDFSYSAPWVQDSEEEENGLFGLTTYSSEEEDIIVDGCTG